MWRFWSRSRWRQRRRNRRSVIVPFAVQEDRSSIDVGALQSACPRREIIWRVLKWLECFVLALATTALAGMRQPGIASTSRGCACGLSWRPRRRPRRSRNMALSASIPRAWIAASRRATISINMPTGRGPRTRRSRPTNRTTACSMCSTICRSERTRQIIEDQAKRSEQPHRCRLCELHGRGRDRGRTA